MFKKKIRVFHKNTPEWFKDWDLRNFKPVESRSSRNEKLIYVILGSVLILDTIGNWYHEDFIEFFIRLFGG